MTVITQVTYSKNTNESIIHYFIEALPVLQNLIHLLQFLRARICIWEDTTHLIPILAYLLVADFILDCKFLKVLIELICLPFQIEHGIIDHSTQVERVVNLMLFNLDGFFGEHDLKGLSSLMNGGFGDEGYFFFGYFPFARIM